MHPCDHAAAQPSRTKTSSRVTKKDSLGGKLRPQTEGTKAVMAERIRESTTKTKCASKENKQGAFSEEGFMMKDKNSRKTDE